MGIANFKRDGKKTVAIVASLSLGGIILTCGIFHCFNALPGSTGKTLFSQMAIIKFIYNQKCQKKKVMAAGNPLNEELKQEILSIDGVTDVIANRQTLHTTFKTDINQNTGNCDMLTDQNYATG
jgi:putative ABC transport system permease protein